LFALQDTEAIITLALDKTGNFVVTSSASMRLKYWNLGIKKSKNTLEHENPTCVRTWKAHQVPVLSLCFDSTSTLVASGGSADQTIKIWDVIKGYCTHNFKGHTGTIGYVCFHPDPGRLQLFSSSDDCSVRIWDLVTKK
jgi:U3 small nucleolar RNA-associated protein 13